MPRGVEVSGLYCLLDAFADLVADRSACARANHGDAVLPVKAAPSTPPVVAPI